MNTQLVITLLADDRPGIVEQVAEVIGHCDGSWLESSLSRLGGKFAGIVLVEIAEARADELGFALDSLAAVKIDARIGRAGEAVGSHRAGHRLLLSLVANDRKGIVTEISQLLAQRAINLEKLHTRTENAAMSGELLFRASAEIVLPTTLSDDELRQMLEQLSDDLIVEIEDLDDR